MIEIMLKIGEIKRATTAGKEQTGNINFMGGQYYVKDLDSKYKDGMHSDIVMEAEFRSNLNSTVPVRIKSATFAK